MKGMAHIGVWLALKERGITPDAVVGTSIGALIGALLAGGMDPEEASRIAGALSKEDIIRVNRRLWWPGGVRQPAAFSGDHYRAFIRGVLPVGTFEELQIPLRMNAVSLETGREIWFGSQGETDLPLADAVYASCALPMYFPPLSWRGQHLADGALRNAVGVDEGLRLGGHRLIVSDVHGDFTEAEAGWMGNGLIAVHERAMSIMAEERTRTRLARWETLPMLRIRPDIGRFGTFDFANTATMVEEGYRAASRALDADPVPVEDVSRPTLAAQITSSARAVGRQLKNLLGPHGPTHRRESP